jgi:hypothetical protein
MANPNQKYLIPMEKPNATQRKAIGVPVGYRHEPRIRFEREATGVQLCNASSKQRYTPGDGDTPIHIEPARLRAFSLPSRGI